MPLQCDRCKRLNSELTELKKSYRDVKASYIAATKTIAEMMRVSRIRYPEMSTEIVCLKDELERLKSCIAE